ncbi:hypothetical protein [Microbulbifer sp.]|uniref:hypothetical protein n=1 Tax=Microbulbifer sp. TaxID=1908541 RepID=UPI00258B771F|nr:hypothetical protein [Microbulbifer sp.]
MKKITDVFRRIASTLYRFRWVFVAGFFLPFLSWSTLSAALFGVLWVWATVCLFMVLSYGPIRHFEGSVIWKDGWQHFAWVFLIPVIFGAVVGTVLIFYALIKNS